MQTPNRAAPHLVLATFLVFNVAGIFLSANSAPPVAREALQLAAANTQAASSFVATLTESDVVSSAAGIPAKPTTKTLTFDVQQPDRVRESGVNAQGQPVTGLAIGDRLFARKGDGPWQSFGGGAGSQDFGAQAVASLTGVLQRLRGAQTVSAKGGVYTFVPSNEAAFIYALLNTQQTDLQSDSIFITASISGEFVSSLGVSALLVTGRPA
ncbi:MAG: hypothetical protein ACYDD4_12830, partial [Acidimicrobiales bacterium]